MNVNMTENSSPKPNAEDIEPVTSSSEVEAGQEAETESIADGLMRSKILHILSIYPFLSQSMLQVGIGTSMSPAIWKPVLESMLQSGEVVRLQVQATSPSERAQNYTVLHLPKNEYTYNN